MAGLGGVGAFAQGFTNSFMKGRENRRLRDQMDLENQYKADREKRLSEQFQLQHEQRQEQLEAIQQYRSGQQEIANKQLELQTKTLDLQTMGAWEKVLDPTKPKAMRKFMFKQMATKLEIDPKSSTYKDFEAMITGMDDESLAEIRAGLLGQLPDATPGQIVALSKAIISGEMEMKDVVESFNEQSKSRKRSDIVGGLSEGDMEQPAAPTKVPTSRITDPNPLSQQPGISQGGNLPVPGMEETTQGTGIIKATPEMIRKKALELIENDFGEDGSRLLTAARDMEAAGKKELELKQIVETDADGNRVEKWVTEEEAVGKEAPSGRPTKTTAEERETRTAQAIIDEDFKRLDPVRQDAEAARSILPPLQAFKIANDSGEFEPGSAAGLRESISKLAQLFGVPEDVQKVLRAGKIGDAATAEAMDSASSQIALNWAGKVSRLTNVSLDLITRAGPSLLRTPQGNALVVEMYQKAADRAIAIDKLADHYIDKYETLRPRIKGVPTFFEERDKIIAKPAFDEKFLKRVEDAEKAGNSIDVGALFGSSDPKKSVTMKDSDGEDVNFDITGTHKAGMPMLRLRDGKDYPYPKDASESHKLEKGELYIRQDPIRGPVLMKAE